MNIIDIVMIAWKREDFTRRTFEAIFENTLYPFRLTLINNEQNYFYNDKIYNQVSLGENIGLEPARNLGLQFVKSKYFVTTDNDILPQKPNEKGCWLTQLVDLMEKNPDFGAIACRPQVLVGTGHIFQGNEDKDIVEFSHPGGSLRIMRTDLVKEVGGWRNIPLRGQEEMYICGKLRERGYKTGFASQIRCYHLFGKDKNWGYQDLKPEKHGHKPVYHPALEEGDNEEEIKKLCGDMYD